MYVIDKTINVDVAVTGKNLTFPLQQHSGQDPIYDLQRVVQLDCRARGLEPRWRFLRSPMHLSSLGRVRACRIKLDQFLRNRL